MVNAAYDHELANVSFNSDDIYVDSDWIPEDEDDAETMSDTDEHETQQISDVDENESVTVSQAGDVAHKMEIDIIVASFPVPSFAVNGTTTDILQISSDSDVPAPQNDDASSLTFTSPAQSALDRDAMRFLKDDHRTISTFDELCELSSPTLAKQKQKIQQAAASASTQSVVCDCTIQVPSKRSVPVHKSVAAASTRMSLKSPAASSSIGTAIRDSVHQTGRRSPANQSTTASATRSSFAQPMAPTRSLAHRSMSTRTTSKQSTTTSSSCTTSEQSAATSSTRTTSKESAGTASTRSLTSRASASMRDSFTVVETDNSSDGSLAPFDIVPTLRNATHRKEDISSVNCPIFARICTIVHRPPKSATGNMEIDALSSVRDPFDLLSVPRVWNWVSSMIEKNKKLKHFLNAGRWHEFTTLIDIGGALATGRLRWFLNIVTDSTDPTHFQIYVGHSQVLHTKIRKHVDELQRPSNTESFHHWVATQPNRSSHYVAFGIGDDVVTRLADAHPVSMTLALRKLVEHYFMLLFQTLPPGALRQWLPEGIPPRAEIGLNIVPPLGADFRYVVAQTSDPDLRRYLALHETNSLFAQHSDGNDNDDSDDPDEQPSGSRPATPHPAFRAHNYSLKNFQLVRLSTEDRSDLIHRKPVYGEHWTRAAGVSARWRQALSGEEEYKAREKTSARAYYLTHASQETARSKKHWQLIAGHPVRLVKRNKRHAAKEEAKLDADPAARAKANASTRAYQVKLKRIKAKYAFTVQDYQALPPQERKRLLAEADAEQSDEGDGDDDDSDDVASEVELSVVVSYCCFGKQDSEAGGCVSLAAQSSMLHQNMHEIRWYRYHS